MSTVIATDWSAEIRFLSSGTIATLLRQQYFADLRYFLNNGYSSRQRLDCNPLMCRDSWIIDRVQRAVALFAGHHQRLDKFHWESWQDVWRSYCQELAGAVHFECSYQGEVDYRVYGQCFTTQNHLSFSEHRGYNGSRDEYEASVVRRLGTIHRKYGIADGFPPVYVACLFPFHVATHWQQGLGWVFDPHDTAPRQGIDTVGQRCAYYCDRQFRQYEPEQYEVWRAQALAARD